MNKMTNLQKVVLLYLVGAILAYAFSVADFEHTALGFLVSIVSLQLEASSKRE